MTLQRRAFLQSGFALGAAYATPAFAQPTHDPFTLVDPELRPIAPMIMRYMSNGPPLSRETLAQARATNPDMARPLLPDTPYEQRRVPGAVGQPDVSILIVNAKSEGARPAILHMHGGGFVMGNARLSLPALQALCAALDCAAISVDYRLAPETTYVGSIEDNYAGLKWLHANAASIGVDPGRIAVMGESAGGGHAALLAIAARDRGEIPIVFQSLIYPMLDDRTGTSRRMPVHVGQLVWTSERNRFGWESFLGTTPGRRIAPRGAAPARVENLSGLPPAWIGVGSLDLFCDEDIDYAQRLNAAGVPAELLVVPGAFHGFDGLPAPTRIADRFNAAKLDALRRGLGISAAA